MRWRQVAFGAAGVFATAVALVAAFAPDAVLVVGPMAVVATWLAALELRFVLIAASGVLGGYVVWSARRGQREVVLSADETASRRFETAIERRPEAVTADAETLTAAGLDADVTRAIEGEDDAMATVRGELSAALRDVLVGHEGQAPESATALIADGTWTDDRTAGAFLADDGGPTYSVLARIRLWLDPDSERERRIARTVHSIERRATRGGEP
jgi:hypothetical protein